MDLFVRVLLTTSEREYEGQYSKRLHCNAPQGPFVVCCCWLWETASLISGGENLTF